MKKTHLNIAAMSVAYFQHSLEYMLDSFQRLGLDKIEFWAAEPHYCGGFWTPDPAGRERLLNLRSALLARGIEVVMYTPETLAYPCSYAHPDPLVRRRTLDYMVRCAKESVQLDCLQMFVNTGCGLRDLPREESWKRTADSYRELCDRVAAESGSESFSLVLEQLQPYESNLVLSLDDCERMLTEVGRDNLKICVDVVAMEVAGETLTQYFDRLGDRIAHIHLSDRNHEILGTHDYPIRAYLDELAARQFDGCVSLEINDSIYWQDPHDSLERSLEYLRKIGY